MQINDSLLTYEEKIIFSLRELFSKYGYSRFSMSRFEEYDLYAKCKDFLVSDRIITFTDLDGRLVALKPDVTLSIVRQFIRSTKSVQKVYYNENVYRAARGNSFKEIMQTGIECMGNLSETDIFEAVALAVRALQVISDDYVLCLSHPDFVGGIFEAAQIDSNIKNDILSFIKDKNTSGLYSYCQNAGVLQENTELLSTLISCHGKMGDCLEKLKNICVNEKTKKAVDEFSAVYNYLSEKGLSDKAQIDFSIANNMDYYDGLMFQGYIAGIPQSLLSGGQYGGLMQKMGKNAAAVGFAVYMDELRYLKNE